MRAMRTVLPVTKNGSQSEKNGGRSERTDDATMAQGIQQVVVIVAEARARRIRGASVVQR